MRIFAFGGIRHSERVSVGVWPQDFKASADFEDAYALPSHAQAISFGVGLRDVSPCLIFRERQTEEDRGGYAYTLLLDPGRDIWERAGWNAARLLLALQGQSELWHDLVHVPERFATETILIDRLGSLPLVNASSKPDRTGALRLAHNNGTSSLTFAETLVASIFADGGMALSARQIGHNGRIALPEMEHLLDELAPTFRVSRGWLMGGRPGCGAKFGCALVIDDIQEAIVDSPELSSFVARARKILELAPELSTSRGAGTGPMLMTVPITEWQLPPRDFLEVIALKADLNAAAGVDGDLERRVAAFGLAPPLLPELRQSVELLLRRSEQPAAVSLSKWFLQTARHVLEISPVVLAKLNPSTVADALYAHGYTLADVPRTPVLPQTFVLETSRRLISLAEPSSIVRVFGAAIADLRGRHVTVPDAIESGLLTAALDRSRDSGVTVRSWTPLNADQALWEAIQPLLAEEARNRVQHRSPGWELDYVNVVDDLGAEQLWDRFGLVIVEQVILIVLGDSQAAVRGSAVFEWLRGLARSPVRLQLSISLKERIAAAVGGPWSRLTELSRVVRGHSTRARQSEVSDLETRALGGELEELLNRTFPAAARLTNLKAVDLSQIADLVGGNLPQELLREWAPRLPHVPQGLRWLLANGYKEEWVGAVDALLSSKCPHISMQEADEGLIAELLTRIVFGRDSETRFDRLYAIRSGAGDLLVSQGLVRAVTTNPRFRERFLDELYSTGNFEHLAAWLRFIPLELHSAVIDLGWRERRQPACDLLGAALHQAEKANGNRESSRQVIRSTLTFLRQHPDIGAQIARQLIADRWSRLEERLSRAIGDRRSGIEQQLLEAKRRDTGQSADFDDPDHSHSGSVASRLSSFISKLVGTAGSSAPRRRKDKKGENR